MSEVVVYKLRGLELKGLSKEAREYCVILADLDRALNECAAEEAREMVRDIDEMMRSSCG